MKPWQLLVHGRELVEEYPKAFRNLVIITLIDHLGGALLFPFFALYITSKFNVGMTQVGILFAAFSFSSFIGSTIGGALTDRIGRRGMLIFSLVSTSLSSVAMGLVNSLDVFYAFALLVGIFTDTGGPARNAMVADLLPKEKHAQGYGIIRVAFNVSAAIGPAIGGFLATRSYLSLFLADAAISIVSAFFVWKTLPETKPERSEGEPQESLGSTFMGYLTVFKDSHFMVFLLACVLMGLVYMNLGTTLGVYLRDVQAVPESGYGFILSLNAVMVVLMQFWITRRIEGYPPMLIMAIGTFLYAAGFAMYGFVSIYALFLFAMVVITIGEMLVAPVSQAIVARFASEQMRGRYMAVFGFSYGIPFAVGPLLAGLVLDNLDPRILWWSAGLVGLLAVAIFMRLHQTAQIELQVNAVDEGTAPTPYP
jgi:MFS family permease